MSISVAASERDLRALAGIIGEDRPDLPAEEGLPPSLLADLMGQIRCDEVFFAGIDSRRQTQWFEQEIPFTDTPGREDLDRAHWQQYWHCQPCSYPDRTGDLRSVVKIADFYSARQWHSTGMYCDHYRPYGLEHELQLCLPGPPGRAAGPGRTVRLYFFRGPGGPDFSDGDRALLTLLRPHLHQAYLDAERRRHPVPRLTPRQRDLLHLVAAGHTNAQIAHRLGISEGTVRTHLENIYGRLQVSSRTAAVTRAFTDRAASLRLPTQLPRPSPTPAPSCGARSPAQDKPARTPPHPARDANPAPPPAAI
jgi:DNA-binding CsgD family transcriptional regulator